MNSAVAFDAVAGAGADFAGFVFFAASPRFVTATEAAALAARSDGGPERVGLFVSPMDAEIAAVLRTVKLDFLQVYTDAVRAREIKAKFGVAVWRAVGVSAKTDLPVDNEGLDGFIIEAKALPDATRPGGNAVTMELGLLRGWQAPGFWLLGGGLNAGNVGDALARSGAPGVDVSSGVETAPGVKSPEMITQFIAAARIS